MKYVGIDLHKKLMVVCVLDKERKVLQRQRLLCAETDRIVEYFHGLGEFQWAVEAMGSFEWLVALLEPLAPSWVLVNPSKFRVIAESTQKTDHQDAHSLAEFLTLGMLPKAYFPSERTREHRLLVRYRLRCRQKLSQIKVEIRQLATRYNADRKDLFEADQLVALQSLKQMRSADRFILKEQLEALEQARKRTAAATKELQKFAAQGSEVEQREREIVASAPGVGEVVTEIVLAELGEVKRFDSIKDATAYAGLVPRKRESAGREKDQGLTKKGSRLLRWAMVEAAWQAVRCSARWRGVYEQLKKRRGSKKAIMAIARRLLGVLVSMLKAGTSYRWSLAELKERQERSRARKLQRARKAQDAAA
jgi:transposase